MTDSRDFFMALARAYALGGVHPPHHPAVRVALAEAMTSVDRGHDASAEVCAGGLSVDGRALGGPGEALGQALARAGVARITVRGEVRTDTLEVLLRRLRSGDDDGVARPSPEGLAGRGLEVTGAPPGVEVGDAASRPCGSVRAPPGQDGPAPAEGTSRDNGGPAPAPDGRPPDFEAAISAYDANPDPRSVAAISEAGRRLVSTEDRRRVASAVRGLVASSDVDRRDPRLVLARRLARPDVLLEVIQDLARRPDPDSRAELTRLAIGLGEAAAGVLAKALAEEDARPARMAILGTTVALGPVALESVRALLSDSRWFVVRNAVCLLPDVGGRLASGAVAEAAGHADARVRREAVVALARLGTPEAGQRITALLDDPEPEVRRSVARALTFLRADGRGPALLSRLRKESEPDVQVALMRALGAAGFEAAVPDLERRAARAVPTPSARSRRIAALQALWGIGTPAARSIVVGALDDRDPEVQGAIRGLLGGR